MNIAELGIAIHSEEAVKAATDLDRLAEAGERAEKSTADLASEAEELDKSLSTTARTTTELSVAEDSLAKSIESANDRIREMVKASLESSEYHQSLAASVTGTSAAMEDAKGAAVDWAAYQEEVNARAQALLATEEQRIASAEKMAAASKKEEESLKKLLAEIDPTRAAIAKLDQQVEELGKQFEAGSIDLETYTKGLEHFDGKYAEIEKVSGSFSKLNLHTKGAREDVLQLGNALTSGNWQGAIRNVTQLGVGASLSATSLIAMVAPIALVVGAVGGLAHGYLRGRKEQDAFNESLVMTGNIAGTTSGQLADMARQVGGTVGTTGTAAAALAHIAGTGKIASESFELVATAALQMEQATGRAVGHTIDEFVKIAGDPVRAARELNDQYHFLTAATYSQIVALEEQGDTIGAAKLLTAEYADVIDTRTADITQNLGLIEQKWNDIKSAAKGVLDGALDVGREKGDEERLQELRAQLTGENSYKVMGIVFDGARASRRDRARIEAEIKVIEERQALAAAAAKEESDRQAIQNEGTKAEEYRVALLKSGWDNATKLAKEYERIEKAVAAAAAADNPWSEEDIARARAIAAERYKPASGSADLSGFNAEKNQLAELLNAYKATNRELEAQQRAGVLSQDEYMSRRVELIKQERDEVVAAREREIAALEAVKNQKGVTAAQSIQLDQRIGAARSAMVKAQQDADSQLAVLAINEEGRLARQAFSVRTYTEALEQQAEALRKQGERAAAGIGMGDRRAQLAGELTAIEDRANQQRLDLARDKADKARNMSAEEYEQKLAAINKSERDLAEITISNYEMMSAAQEDWRSGATSAFENYLESARDVSGQTKNLFTSAFSSMEDAVVNFAMTGKLSFADFTKSVLADMARIASRQASMSMLGGLVSIGTSLFAGGAAAGANANDYTGAAYSNWLAGSRAIGGPVGPNSLYEVNELGPELLNQGGKTFLMTGGEGGTITPLGAGPASLAAASAASAVAPQVNIVIHRDGSSDVEGDAAMASRAGPQIVRLIQSEIAKNERKTLASGGNTWRVIHGR